MKMFIFKAIFTLCFSSISNALNPAEDLKFIRYASVWRKGQQFELDDCLFYNFGYERDLPYTSITSNLGMDLSLSLNINGMEAPSGCSIVLIAGKYVRQVDEVMKRVDDIAEQTNSVPLVAFIFENYYSQDIEIDSSLRDDYSPAMVIMNIKTLIYFICSSLDLCPNGKLRKKFHIQSDVCWRSDWRHGFQQSH